MLVGFFIKGLHGCIRRSLESSALYDECLPGYPPLDAIITKACDFSASPQPTKLEHNSDPNYSPDNGEPIHQRNNTNTYEPKGYHNQSASIQKGATSPQVFLIENVATEQSSAKVLKEESKLSNNETNEEIKQAHKELNEERSVNGSITSVEG